MKGTHSPSPSPGSASFQHLSPARHPLSLFWLHIMLCPCQSLGQDDGSICDGFLLSLLVSCSLFSPSPSSLGVSLLNCGSLTATVPPEVLPAWSTSLQDLSPALSPAEDQNQGAFAAVWWLVWLVFSRESHIWGGDICFIFPACYHRDQAGVSQLADA